MWSIVVNVNVYIVVKVVQRSKVVKVVNSGQSGYIADVMKSYFSKVGDS
jgi:hypothetical protein